MLDTLTGLTWRRLAPMALFDWEGASAYCAEQLGSDWRLPDLSELETLIDEELFDPAIDRGAFPNMAVGTGDELPFWTSSVKSNDASQAWVVDFEDGKTSLENKTTRAAVRCVRGP